MIEIGGKKIGKGERCFTIAEAGVNHILNQEDMKLARASSPLEVALQLVDLARLAGADAIKFQSFKAEKLQYQGTEKPEYQKKSLGAATEYFDLIKSLETSEEDQIRIAEYCKKRGIIFLSTPYDRESTDFLERKIGVEAYKLASIELTNHLFLRYVARKGKPIILSTGLGDIKDVDEVVRIATSEGFIDRLILLQCTSNYPTKPEDVNLNVLRTYMERYPGLVVGLSDHTPNDIASIGSIAIGAKVLEKHFTLDKTFKGPDHSSSLDPEELKTWIKNVRTMEETLGSLEKRVTGVEIGNASMKKYLVLRPQKAGTILTEDSFETMRTGEGILPIDENLTKILGKKLKLDIRELVPFKWEMIE